MVDPAPRLGGPSRKAHIRDDPARTDILARVLRRDDRGGTLDASSDCWVCPSLCAALASRRADSSGIMMWVFWPWWLPSNSNAANFNMADADFETAGILTLRHAGLSEFQARGNLVSASPLSAKATAIDLDQSGESSED